MSERIRYELLLTGLSLVMGGWLMIVYDSLRLLRLLIHHNSLLWEWKIFFTGSMLEEPYLCCCMNRMTEAFGFMP